MKVLKAINGTDGSTKYLFELKDKTTIETLYMFDRSLKLTYNSTICVSSQVGCNMGCVFCATGQQGFTRNLIPTEIEQQVNICNIHCKEAGTIPIEAVVFAGMGEPLLNYENVKTAIFNIVRNMGIHDFELVTVGIVPTIYKLINDFLDKSINIRLNISLHATLDKVRKKIIPITQENCINDIIDVAVKYAKAFNNTVRLRYILFDGINDTEDDVQRIIGLLKNKPLKLILSQYNENNIPCLTSSSELKLLDFYKKVKGSIDCEIFHSFGLDIKGGCGQLKQSEIT